MGCCHRCGDALVNGHVVLRASHVHGRLVLCLDCSERFLDWLRSGQAGAPAWLPRPRPARPAVRRLPRGLADPTPGPATVA